eukprot:gnl/Spiro4/6413_TR3291_c0_g2_i1.p1 gnl/Spiro4/6413_TR3291_c0_g2~~gnl/Spiro4/6413_TR3291_c0_g2_i1.p1  ORF type:complete len:586 (+),score=73.70 gnl/Spiro4/6413_TR3291_c0_g2_i1:32-1759(+)
MVFVGQLRCLSVNDIYLTSTAVRGGYLGLERLIEQYRTSSSLFFVCGDFLSGCPIAVDHKGRNVIEILNHLRVDAVVVGNHEFDFGPEVLTERMKESQFPWLSTNISEGDDVTTVFAGSVRTLVRTLEVKFTNVSASSSAEETLRQVRVGLFGATTQNCHELSYPGPNVHFACPVAAATQAVAQLQQEGCDVIIGVTHVSLDVDRQIAKIPGVTMIFGGHEHEPMTVYEHAVPIFKCGQNAYYLGVADIALECSDDTVMALECVSVRQAAPTAVAASTTTTTPSSPLTRSDTTTTTTTTTTQQSLSVLHPHPSATTVTSSASAPPCQHAAIKSFVSLSLICNRELVNVERPPAARSSALEEIIRRFAPAESLCDPNEILTVLQGPLDGRTASVRRSSASLGSLVADAMCSAVHADIAFINGGFLRSDRLYPTGHPYTNEDLSSDLPFPLKISLVALKGRSLRLALEQMLRFLPAPCGAFPHPSRSVVITYDPEAEPLSRLRSFLVAGQPLEDTHTYSVAMTSFMHSGGDGVSGLAEGTRMEEDHIAVATTVRLLLKTQPLYVPDQNPRVQPVVRT